VDVIEIKQADFDRYLGVSKSVRNDLTLKWRARTLKYAKNLLRLQKNVVLKTYKKGDVIYKEGDLGNAMYRVDDIDGGKLNRGCSSFSLNDRFLTPSYSGELTVSHAGRIVHKYTAGDSFGESSLLFNRPRS
jgi:CRP-like cAMP-binding protein